MIRGISRNHDMPIQRIAAEAKHQKVSLYKRFNVFFAATYIRIANVLNAYKIFTVEPLDLFRFGIDKRMKKFTVAYFSREETMIENRGETLQRHFVKLFKNIILDGWIM